MIDGTSLFLSMLLTCFWFCHRLAKTKGKTNKAASLSSLTFGPRKTITNKLLKPLHGSKKQSSSSAYQTNSSSVNKGGQKRSAGKQNAKNGAQGDSSRPDVLSEQITANSMKKGVCLDDFSLVQTVGKGSFGRVIQVRKKDTGKIYAMKVLKKEQVIKRKQFEHTMAERRILEDIDHPFIVSLRFAFQTTQKLFMVFDFFNGGELFHYLSKTGRFGEERAKLYSAEILLGLEHVHSLNIIYRDLKPENLLLDSDGHIRITDFGLSKENVFDDSVKSFCGTPEYLAPEVLRRQKYGKAVDWWSLGTLLYEMIAGLPPFYDRNREKMYKKVLGMELRFPTYMTPEARSICRGLLQRNPLQRLGYGGAHEIKCHPFYAELNWQDVYGKRITPKFVPQVSGIEDTRNIDKVFTQIPACVTPTPADSKLIDKEFTDFTFTAQEDGLGVDPTAAGFDFYTDSPITTTTQSMQADQYYGISNNLDANETENRSQPAQDSLAPVAVQKHLAANTAPENGLSQGMQALNLTNPAQKQEEAAHDPVTSKAMLPEIPNSVVNKPQAVGYSSETHSAPR